MKTEDEIEGLLEALQTTRDWLPRHNIFGSSNKKEKDKLYELITDLMRVNAGLEAETVEVQSWLEGKDDYLLNDYLG